MLCELHMYLSVKQAGTQPNRVRSEELNKVYKIEREDAWVSLALAFETSFFPFYGASRGNVIFVAFKDLTVLFVPWVAANARANCRLRSKILVGQGNVGRMTFLTTHTERLSLRHSSLSAGIYGF